MLMPRLPVDGKKVIEYRVTLGAKERELFQDAQWSYTFGKVGSTVSGILGNPVILLGIAGYIAYKLDELLDPDWRAIVEDMTPDQIKDWLETQNLVGATIGGILGLFIGGPFGAVFGSILGSATVELGEAALDAAGEVAAETIPPAVTIGIVSTLIQVMNALEEMGTALQPDWGGPGDSQGTGGGGAF
jgi:hypothetical protein